MILIALYLGITLHYLMILICAVRVLTRRGRDPSARVAWLLVVSVLPFFGVLLYVLFGELNIGRKARRRMAELIATLPARAEGPSAGLPPEVAGRLFDRAAAVNGFSATTGNRVEIPADSAAVIDRLLADIAGATAHVHLLFYIWLPDGSGLRVAEALKAAARRGVACRVMVDGMGSRLLLRHPVWAELAAAGVETGVAFPIRWPLLRAFVARVDLRNHRKIAVIDGGITWFGSQNCADAAFAIKPRFAPWVDIMARAEGPIAWQQQQLFVTDWTTHTGKPLDALLRGPGPVGNGPVAGIACGTGPTIDTTAVSDLFQLAAAQAERDLCISTPYYVPNEAVTHAIRVAALRGVRVRMLLPARNDSRFVALASRSYYEALIEAGVEILEFAPGLLHAKTVAVDGHTVIIGSPNMDRRSFELNYENCVVLEDAAVTAAVRARQAEWAASARVVGREEVARWHLPRRALQNLVATLGPLL